MFLLRQLPAALLLTTSLLAVSSNTLAQVPTKQWDKAFGGSGTDAIYAMHQTSDGGYIMGGPSNSDISSDKSQAGQGGLDYWVVKLDATGSKVWDRTFGGSGDDYLRALQPTPDGGFLLGGESKSGISGDKSQVNQGNYDYWVVKIDANGNKAWDRTLGGAAVEYCLAVQPTRDGGYVLGGLSNSGVGGDKTQASQGDYDYWTIKLGGTVTTTASSVDKQVLSVYPNPAHGRFTVRMPKHANLRLSLLDGTGHLVLTQLLSASPVDVPVEIGQQPVGLYLLRLEGPNGYLSTARILLE
ncbi:MAG TPA: T9SS type A sorting domain-containing protein [Hymenobacter sp.]|jgi:hypothetical protein